MKLATLCSLSVIAAATFTMTDSASAAEQHTYTNGRVSLKIAGASVTTLKTFDGSATTADIVTEARTQELRTGASTFQKKHRGTVHVDPIELDTGLNPAINGWVTDLLNGNVAPRAVTESVADFNYKEQSRFDFPSTRLAQIDFPALDGSSRDNLALHLTLQPDSVRRSAGSGADIRQATGTPPASLVTSNFKVTLGSLPCNRVATVAPFSVKNGAGGLTVTNITMTVSIADYAGWQTWMDATASAESADGQEKAGAIEYMDAAMATVQARISLKGVGLVRLLPAPVSGNPDAIQRFTVELYVEDVKFWTPG